MPRFVLLYHDCPTGYVRPSHWDLMLESGDVLETWAVAQLPRDWQAAHAQTAAAYPNCPTLAAGNVVEAEHLAGHRLAYLEFEGPLTDDRGEVVRIAAGQFEFSSQAAGHWVASMAAGPLGGEITLDRPGSGGSRWMLAYRPAGNR